MSFVTTIRDYVEVLNTLSASLNQDVTLTKIFSETAIYVLKTLQTGFFYLVSFQWIRDFTLLPIVLPQNYAAIFKEAFFLETPSKVFFDFLEIPDFHQNKFLLGFLNSFFLCLPLSIVHILAVRRLLIQGIPAAVFSIGGYLCGQILFLTCTVFGLRDFLIPWITLEPLNYVLGFILIFRIIYSMVRENLVKKAWTQKDVADYKTFFLTCFLLAWCEQTSIFQYLGNLTFSSNVTVLESFSSNSPFSSFFTHFLYIVGVSCGSVIFTSLWGVFFLQVKNWCLSYTPIFLTSFIQTVNKTTFVFALALSLTSIPFYGVDYLITGPLGFVSQDNLFKNTVFDEVRVRDVGGVGLLSSGESGLKYLDIDTASFDRGEYLTTSDVVQEVSFEDLNYRGEFDWLARQDKVSGITDRRSGFFTLSKVFKKRQSKKSDTLSVGDRQLDENRLIGENREPVDTQSPLFERFLKETELPYEDAENPTLKAYHEFYITSFPTDYLRMTSILEPQIEQKIKQKYYSNPVYKTLLALDIDLFLKRQPDNFRVTAVHENDLCTKRKMLESYYDSLRHYSNLPYNEEFDLFFDGTKSFSSKVYNQQFKGTLRSVNRLFALTLNPDSNRESQTLLKFDQPLYDLNDKPTFSPYHEELGTEGQSFQDPFTSSSDFASKPLYAGWDEHERKFFITTKLLPRKSAGYKVKVDGETRRQFLQDKKSKQSQRIKFTTWPLSKEKLTQNESNVPYMTLFESLSELSKGSFDESLAMKTFPRNLERFEVTLKKKGEVQKKDEGFISLSPKRGGFIWPGNAQFNFSSLFKT